MNIEFSPIGIIHSPFQEPDQMPIQPGSSASADGYVEVFTEFTAGLKDLNGFSHIFLLYYLHKVNRVDLNVTPFLDEESRGVFATRAPTRPNPIGLSVVRLTTIEKNILYLANIDILNGTPLLDIKPYVPEFDHPENVKIGWLRHARERMKSQKSDNRFK